MTDKWTAERFRERIKNGEITSIGGAGHKADWFKFEWPETRAALAAGAEMAKRLEAASDPRHCWPCETCGHVVEVACELGSKLAAAEAKLAEERARIARARALGGSAASMLLDLKPMGADEIIDAISRTQEESDG